MVVSWSVYTYMGLQDLAVLWQNSMHLGHLSGQGSGNPDAPMSKLCFFTDAPPSRLTRQVPGVRKRPTAGQGRIHDTVLAVSMKRLVLRQK